MGPRGSVWPLGERQRSVLAPDACSLDRGGPPSAPRGGSAQDGGTLSAGAERGGRARAGWGPWRWGPLPQARGLPSAPVDDGSKGGIG